MESASATPTAHQIADLVMQLLIDGGGIPDLANANLMTIEQRTIGEVDRVTQIVIGELLAKQSREADPVTASTRNLPAYESLSSTINQASATGPTA